MRSRLSPSGIPRTDGPRKGLSSDIAPSLGRRLAPTMAIFTISGQRSAMITQRHLGRSIAPSDYREYQHPDAGQHRSLSHLAKPRTSVNASFVMQLPMETLAFNT